MTIQIKELIIKAEISGVKRDNAGDVRNEDVEEKLSAQKKEYPSQLSDNKNLKAKRER